MKFKIHIIVLLILGCSAFAKAQLSTFTTATNELLNEHFTNGKVDYATIKRNPQQLKRALTALKKISLEKLNVIEREALHINAYNLFVIQGVVDAYPIKSVKDIPNFFDAKKYNLGNKKVSLNQLEKEILFSETWDERLHFVLVCGAVGCPPLKKKAFTADNTELMLRNMTKIAINDPQIVSIDMHEKKALVSKIFDWYNADFTRTETLKEYINQYRDQKIPDGFTIEFLEYDWSLNGK